MESLKRFHEAQKYSYDTALNEIKSGRKNSCWMWYIFPQIKGLGNSSYSAYYAISDIDEAREYIEDEVLGGRLIEMCQELLKLKSNNASEVFGFPDDMKLKSSMTLFWKVSGNEIFKNVIDKFFNGEEDELTLKILNNLK